MRPCGRPDRPEALTERMIGTMLKRFSIAVMVLSGYMLLACFVNKPKESRYHMMVTAAILFSGSQISLAICTSRKKSPDRSTKDTPS